MINKFVFKHIHHIRAALQRVLQNYMYLKWRSVSSTHPLCLSLAYQYSAIAATSHQLKEKVLQVTHCRSNFHPTQESFHISPCSGSPKQFILEAETSDTGVGAVLSQCPDCDG